jgi:hypothetical protein
MMKESKGANEMMTKQQGINKVKNLIGYDSSNPFESRKVDGDLFNKIGRTYRDVEVIVTTLGSNFSDTYYVDRETGEVEKA